MEKCATHFFNLTPEGKLMVHIFICEYALSKWKLYIKEKSPIEYCDTVIGMYHVVDGLLPGDALVSVKAGKDLSDVASRYGEPIVAIQDDDLVFPEHIKYGYYAIYNCFRKYVLNDNIDDWLIVNQAISSETDSGKWNLLLEDAILKTEGKK